MSGYKFIQLFKSYHNFILRSSFVSSTASTNSTLTFDGGPIPVTVKNLEEEVRRKSGVAMLNGSLDSWDYVYRQLENIGYTKDQVRTANSMGMKDELRGVPCPPRLGFVDLDL